MIFDDDGSRVAWKRGAAARAPRASNSRRAGATTIARLMTLLLPDRRQDMGLPQGDFEWLGRRLIGIEYS